MTSVFDNGQIIVGPIMIFDHEYDPNQLWLPFVIAVVKTSTEPSKLSPMTRYAIEAMISKKYANVHREDRKFYIHKKGVDQLVIPFIEAKQVEETEWNELIETDFPGWERSSKGYIPKLNVPQNNETLEWLHDNCRGRFRYKSKSVRFEFMSDYAMACLKFMI